MTRRFAPPGRALAAAGVLALVPALPAHAQSADEPTAVPAAAPPARPPERAVFGATAVSFVHLQGADRTWSLASAGVAINTGTTGVTTLEVERAARPGLANVRGVVRHDVQLSEKTSAYVQASASGGDPLREE